MPAHHDDGTRCALFGALFHPSGGLVYHWRALRWRRALWASFHDQVRRWLADWRPEARHLVLIGPSGGYALTSRFLDRFGPITVLEPDPLARHILARRFPDHAFDWRGSDRLARPGGFRRLADGHPDAAFLFCNLLGQMPRGAAAGFDRRAWLAEIEAALSGHAWASWQDLASTDRRPDRRDGLVLDRAIPLDAVLGHYWQGGELAIHDHDCAGMCPSLPRACTTWQLRPGRWHLVEWLACRGAGTDSHALDLAGASSGARQLASGGARHS